MSKKDIRDLLDKYLAAQCTPSEREQVEKWLESVQREDNAWHTLGEPARERMLDAGYQNIKQSVSKEGKVIPIGTRSKSNWRMISAVAAAFLIGGLVFSFWSSLFDSTTLQYIEVTADRGHRKEVTLPDGTHLWLNAGSRLTYSSVFNQITREVSLEGEGFFKVAHNPEKPFVVQTGHLRTKVLGTVFNVNAYKENASVQVVLASGKVALEQQHSGGSIAGPGMELTPNQAAIFYKLSGELVKQEITNVEDHYAWTEGRLVFQDTPVPEALQRLERAYGVTLTADGQIRNCTITGTFKTKQPLKQIMHMISTSTGGDFRPAGQGGSLHGAGCN